MSAANPNTVVVLNTGSAVTMPWVDRVEATIEAWYPGQEDGNAIAAVLFGDVNPSGKLPLGFPASKADTPARTPQQWPGVDGNADYTEGLAVGYRWYETQGITPLFPFGYGLSYTSFRIGAMTNRPLRLGPSGRETVVADITNTGDRAGKEVVQLYVGLPPNLHEPPKRLAGFHKVALQPGQRKRVEFRLTARELSFWDETAHAWLLAPGEYSVMVGTSWDDIAASGSFQVVGS